MNTYQKIAITFNNTKEAAIYFDYIVPFGSNFEWVIDSLIINNGKDYCKRPQDVVLPPTLRKNHSFSIDFYRATQMHSSILFGHKLEVQDKIAQKKIVKQDSILFYQEIHRIIKKYNLDNIPIICSKYHLMENANNECENSNFIISLPPLGLIDTKNVSWDKIEEFRKDSECRAKLRRLRLFAYENYRNKSICYIEDDILSRIDDYEQTTKRWGFETKQEIISMILSSRILGGAVSGCLISTYLGADTQAILTAIGGASIELGRIGIMLKKRKYNLANILEDNPISYIAAAKDRLKN